MSKIYKIPEWSVDILKGRIAVLQGKAQKIGCEPITLKEHGEGFIDDLDENDQPNGRKIKVFYFSVEGDAPKLSNWIFIGRIEHSPEYGNLLHESPSCQIPTSYREADSTCDHCKTNRYRKDTFIVKHVETGEYKQVGRSCLKDFLGHPSPEEVVSFLTSLWQFNKDLLDNSEDSDFYSKGNIYYSQIIEVLARTSAVIRTYGWTSKGEAYESFGKTATAELVSLVLFGKGRDAQALRESTQVKDSDKEKAEKAIEFVKYSNDDSNYFHNLKQIVATGHVSEDKFGYVCSIIPTYEKALQKERTEGKIIDEYLSEKGKRLEIKATLLRTWFKENNYNDITGHVLISEEGHSLLWPSSSGIGEIKDRFDLTDNPKDDFVQPGATYYITATVKDHRINNFDNKKQTVLTRCEFRLNPKTKKKAKSRKKKAA